MRPLKSESEWREILIRCGVKIITATIMAPVWADTVKEGSFSQGVEEIDDFLGQVLHESAGLTQFSENLNYSAERLVQVWPGRFPTLADARPYALNPEALANRVYGGRMGNVELGDGWRFRGRGPIQLTGRANYAAVGDLIGQDLVTLPELMEQPRYALEATIAWWEDRIPDSMLGDPERVTKRVNGGLIGLADRETLSRLAQEAFA
ncbi:MAG: glycoside hydrolase family 19 protein [Pseudomonadota bacterium]